MFDYAMIIIIIIKNECELYGELHLVPPDWSMMCCPRVLNQNIAPPSHAVVITVCVHSEKKQQTRMVENEVVCRE